MRDFLDLKRFVALDLDFGPDIDACGESQAATLGLIEGRNPRRTGGYEPCLLRGLMDQRGQQILDDAVTDGGTKSASRSP